MVKKILSNKKLLKRILVTLGLILVFRLGTLITIPGANVLSDESFDSGSFLGILNMLGGGGLTSFSIFALGVSPYITSSIIVQLLSADVIPPLARLNKQGERGRIKVEKITRIIAFFFAIVQAIAIIISLQNSGYIESTGLFGGNEWVDIAIYTLILVSGTFITLFLADQITMKGVGNGTSMIIFTGIVAVIPEKITSSWAFMVPNSSGSSFALGIFYFLLFISLFLLTIYILGFFESSERRIPIQQTGQGLNLIKESETYLPIKLNPAGIVPVIFASAIITLPPTVAQFFPDTSSARHWVETWFQLTHPFGLSTYAVLIISFTYFYSHIMINPSETSENFEKSSTFIMGVKPGKDTQKYLGRTINAMATIGAVVLTIIAISPYVMTFFGIPESISLGGTSILIMTSVAVDTWEQIKARAISFDSKDKNISNKMRKYGKMGTSKTLKDDSSGDLIF